jgi:hypothetical protein
MERFPFEVMVLLLQKLMNTGYNFFFSDMSLDYMPVNKKQNGRYMNYFTLTQLQFLWLMSQQKD